MKRKNMISKKSKKNFIKNFMNITSPRNHRSAPSLTLDQRIQVLYESGMTCAAQVHRRLTRTV